MQIFFYFADAQELKIFAESPLRAQIGSKHMIDCEVINAAANEDPNIQWKDIRGDIVTNSGQ